MEGQFKSWTGTDYVPIDKWHQLVLNDKVEYAAYQLKSALRRVDAHTVVLKVQDKEKFNFIKKFLGDTCPYIEKCKNVAASHATACMKESE